MATLRLAARPSRRSPCSPPRRPPGPSRGSWRGHGEAAEAAGAGQAQVLALDIDTMAYGAAAPVGRNGTTSSPAGGQVGAAHRGRGAGQAVASFTSAAIVTRATGGAARSRSRSSASRSRARKRRPHVANINPRDGRHTPARPSRSSRSRWSATTTSPGSATAMPDMQINELFKAPPCPYTIVEWRRRDVDPRRDRASRTEYIDPAARVEDGHLIDPEILIRGRVEDRPGTPRGSRCSPGSWTRRPARGCPGSQRGHAPRHRLRRRRAARRADQARPDLRPRQGAPPAPRSAAAPRPPPPPPSPPVPTAATTSTPGRSRARRPPSCRASARPGAGRSAWTPRRTRRRPSRRPTAPAGQLPHVHRDQRQRRRHDRGALAAAAPSTAPAASTSSRAS